MVLNRDPLGIISTTCVYFLLFYGDLIAVYYVIEYGQSDSLWKTFQAFLMHVLLILALVSHLRSVFSNPGYVPLSPTKIDFSSDLEKDVKKKKPPPSMTEWSVCTKCETFRPPRSHHCRKCGRCVRRMDHHCPWINNCVGQLNFKYFYLFLVYTGLMCLYGIILISIDWVQHWGESSDTVDTVLTVILFIEAVVFGMFTTAVGCGQTMATVCDRNAIELKRYGPPNKWTPYRTWLPNIAIMCGRGSKLFWLLPCISPRIPDPVPPTDLDASQLV